MRLQALILLTILPLSGCPTGGQGRCAQDRIRCAGDAPFEVNATCASDAPLTVQLSFSRGEFEPVSSGPVVESGPQGGQHIFVGVRIEGAELDRYDRVQATFSVSSGCSADAGESCAFRAERRVVFGAVEPIVVAADGAIEELSYTLEADTFGDTSTVAVEVLDPCGRMGSDRWSGAL